MLLCNHVSISKTTSVARPDFDDTQKELQGTKANSITDLIWEDIPKQILQSV